MEFPDTPTLTPANWGHAVTLSDRPYVKPSHRHAVTTSGRPDVTPSHQQAVAASRQFGSGSSGRITDTVTQNRNHPFRDYTATTIKSSQYGTILPYTHYTTMDESEMQTPARVHDGQWSSGLTDGHWRSSLPNAHFSSGLPEGHGSSSLHDGHRSSGYQLNPFLSELNGQHVKQTGARVQFQTASTPIRQTLRQPAAAGNTTTMTVEETKKTNADTRTDGHQFQNGSSCKEDAIDVNQVTPTCQAEKEMTPQKVTTGRKQLKVHKFDGSTSFDSYLAQFMNAAAYNGWNKIDQLAHMKASLQGAAANVLWDTPADKTDTIDHLTSILHTQFGTMGMAERFRIDLRSKRRKPSETNQQLHLEVQRLASLAFPGPRSGNANRFIAVNHQETENC
jgi:hypothetical protein